MVSCSVHTHFFDDHCIECKKEYREMKGIVEQELTPSNENDKSNKATRALLYPKIGKYKEFTEECGKKLYEELIFKKGCNEIEASEKSRRIIRKQCSVRGISL
jgi:hypothetical protein